MLFGLTIMVFGIAMILSRRFPTWLGGLGLVGGLTTLAAGVAQAYTGFSPLAMTLSMPASALLLLWAVFNCALLWRLAPMLSARNGAD